MLRDWFSSAEERQPLLSTHGSPRLRRKGRCWCCWDTDETQANPLIRVCLGCKDPDLRWIHQKCVDRWISSLPERWQPPGDPFVPTNIPDGSALVSPYQVIAESDIRRVSDHTGNTEDTSQNSASSLLPPSAPLPSPTRTASQPVYYCTRCRHPYVVTTKPIHPLIVLWRDRFIFSAMALMTVCIITLHVCCGILIVQHFGKGHYLIDLAWFKLEMSTFAILMLLFCNAVNGATWSMVWKHLQGRTSKNVHGLILSEEFLDAEEVEDDRALTQPQIVDHDADKQTEEDRRRRAEAVAGKQPDRGSGSSDTVQTVMGSEGNGESIRGESQSLANASALAFPNYGATRPNGSE
ncbi:hypothetical protein BJ742DRAFT_803051 [Cladochytrium replicatum]|nr:hypothetical protein BJ742DRAFT_803051 [Cladochytrium replicatum]